MLFSSYGFLFCFLPLALLAWQFAVPLAGRWRAAPGVLLLGISLIFYALWGLGFLALFLALIGMNSALGTALADAPERASAPGPAWRPLSRPWSRRALLTLGVTLNVLPLVWFKYSAFLADTAASLLGLDWQCAPPALPLGISFYTFIQIAWLVSIARGQVAPQGLLRHALFVSCFPWVISGPIVRYEQMGPQLERLGPVDAGMRAQGFVLLSLGLAKKILLADSIGAYADAVFSAAQGGIVPSVLEAWIGSLAYTFQLYFDFSGYTDMALGLGLMFGLRLPENFDSPYKATGIVDFWRRWHMTLSAWLRDFLYIPLGGNRHGRPRQYCNLVLTMLIGGAWHGAGWTFILWGALHGGMLVVNHWFRAAIRGSRAERLLASAPGRLVCIALTFFCINFCWVLFRAPGLETARVMYDAMFCGQLLAWQPVPLSGADAGAGLAGFLAWLDPGNPQSLMAALLPNHFLAGWLPWALLLVCGVVVWLCPNSRQIVHGREGSAEGRAGRPEAAGRRAWLVWRPSRAWATGLAVLTLVSLLLASRATNFLYFQF